jgi:hypothetical protein
MVNRRTLIKTIILPIIEDSVREGLIYITFQAPFALIGIPSSFIRIGYLTFRAIIS